MEFPITRKEFDALVTNVNALNDWTKEAVRRIKELEALAATVKEKLGTAAPASATTPVAEKPKITLW